MVHSELLYRMFGWIKGNYQIIQYYWFKDSIHKRSECEADAVSLGSLQQPKPCRLTESGGTS
jgi:hypothetical protein